MKVLKSTWVLLSLGIFLILIALLSSKAVYGKVLDMFGHYGMEKVVITTKSSSIPQNQQINLRDIERIHEALTDRNFTYSTSIDASIQVNTRAAEANIVGTNNVLPKYKNIHLLRGSFFTKNAEDESNAVAIIDDRLAWKLFSSVDVVGNKIKLLGKNFSIIGVFSWDESFVQKMLDDGTPVLYVPATTLLQLYKGACITNLEVNTLSTDILGKSTEHVIEALQAAGKNPEDYNLIDFNIKKAQIRQKPEILLFLLGFIMFLISFSYIKKETTAFVSKILREAKNDYLSCILRARFLEILLLFAKILAVTVFVVILWRLVRFNLYIPPEYIPSDLTDISYYKDLIRNSINKSNEALGYTPSTAEQIINLAQKLTDTTFYICLTIGLLLFYIGMYQARALKTNPLKLSILCGTALVVSVIVLTALLYNWGMELYDCTASIATVWIFLTIHTLKLVNVKERSINDV